MRWGGSKLVSEAVWCNSRHAHYKYVVTYRLQREAAQTSREEAVPSAPPAGVATWDSFCQRNRIRDPYR